MIHQNHLTSFLFIFLSTKLGVKILREIPYSFALILLGKCEIVCISSVRNQFRSIINSRRRQQQHGIEIKYVWKGRQTNVYAMHIIAPHSTCPIMCKGMLLYICIFYYLPYLCYMALMLNNCWSASKKCRS